MVQLKLSSLLISIDTHRFWSFYAKYIFAVKASKAGQLFQPVLACSVLAILADAITELSTEATLTFSISKCLKDLKQQVRS